MRRLIAAALVTLIGILPLLGACRGTPPTGRPGSKPPESGSATDAPGSPETTGAPQSATKLELEPYDGGFFTLQKPVGWEIITAGEYSTFAFLLRDPENPARQVFYLGQISPLYISQRQKDIDRDYMSSGGNKVPWYDMPVISPLVPSQLFINFGGIADSELGQAFMPEFPRLDDFEVLNEEPADSPFNTGKTTLTRGFFVQDGTPCEGQFFATVAPFIPEANGPGGGTAIAVLVVGIAAPVSEFNSLEGQLAACVNSFKLSDSYVREGIAKSQEDFEGVLEAGKTMSETSDIITDGWESRNKTDDILSQKRSDATLGRERVYDPSTGEVYDVPNGFYEQYDPNRQEYDMNGLQQLPGNAWPLWTAPTLNGNRIH